MFYYNQKNSGLYLISGAIILAGVLVVLSVFARGTGNEGNIVSSHSGIVNRGENTAFGNNLSKSAENMRTISSEDHIRGDKEAVVSIVEYSDFECPFCARLHPTLSRIVDENPDVKWIYRHFPLTQIHGRAHNAAVASECIAEIGGNDAFWVFADKVFANEHSLGDSFYVSIASGLGISEEDFNACTKNTEASSRVAEDLNDATRSGGRGTPYSVVISKSGALFPFSGALPYESVIQIVNSALES